MTYLPFWLPLPLLGFAPWMILLAQSWSLLYQFWIHTERIGTLPRPLEAVLNTPSHHRVHHGSNEQYLDRNYGGILIIWDRLFGTFEPEGERVRYGLTTNIETFNPVQVAFHEYAAMWPRRARGAARGATRWHLLLRGPGYEPPQLLQQAREPAVLEHPARRSGRAGSSSSRSPRRRPPRARVPHCGHGSPWWACTRVGLGNFSGSGRSTRSS